MNRFDLVTLRDGVKPSIALFHGSFTNLIAARNARILSGEVVVHTGTTRIVKDPTWLWDWEREDGYSYAGRLVRDTH
jgi:hypothetical protein